jgi:hypothetical protein
MSWDSLILLLVALAVWGLSVVARWFQEQMEKHSTDGLAMEPIDWSAPAQRESASLPQASVPSDQPQEPPPAPPEPVRKPRQKAIKQRLGLDSPQTLRQGMILMIVLGPCRALEKPDETFRL